MAKSLIPNEVYQDVENFFTHNGICHMDANRKSNKELGEYTIDLGGRKQVSFNNVQLAPPQGVVAANYSRHIHFEHQPHKYAFAWTTSRTLSADISDGGHFYLSRYGIRVCSAPNSLVIWMPTEHHGTGLPNITPSQTKTEFYQSGMSIVTSNKILSVWNKYKEDQMKASVLKDRDSYLSAKEHLAEAEELDN
jgi:hypothetical protein